MNLQEAFPFVTKAEWLAQIEKDLKGNNPSSLDWQYTKRLSFSPTASVAELPPLPSIKDWEIGEYIVVNDPKVANIQVLEALQFGVEGLHFFFINPPDQQTLEQLLNGVYLDFVGLHFDGPGVNTNPGAILALLANLCTQNNLNTRQLRGSLGYDPLNQSKLQDWRYLHDLIELAQDQFPGFQLIRLSNNNPNPEEGIAELINNANHYLIKLYNTGINPGITASIINCQLSIGTHYLIEVAKIRAFKIVWMNWLKAWKSTVAIPIISCVFQKEAYSDSLYTNMIKATTMAMSAILGGANQLTVKPYDEDRENNSTYPPQFARRIARNVQHLLKMESGFDQLQDPAAGSHYIEHATNQIANEAWQIFQNTKE